MPKNPLASKTMIFNLIALVVAVALNYGYDAFEPSKAVYPLAGGIAALVTILTPLLNMGLRLITKQPVSLRKLFTLK